jgi:hypothetical protein
MLNQLFKYKVLLPVSLSQFETLVNELLVEFNKVSAPNALDANYMAQVVMSVIHALDRKVGKVSKTELLDGCINMVSKHISYHACEAIKAQLEAEKKAAEPQQSPEEDPSNVVPMTRPLEKAPESN